MLPRLNIPPRRTMLPALPIGHAIPKILHQTFPTKELPKEIRTNIEKLRSMNPEYEYRFYDDADMAEFIRSNYDSRILNYFNRINPKYGAARADLFRYLLIYKCGGVYLDIKSSVTRPLRETLRESDRYLLAQWRNAEGEAFAGRGLHRELSAVAGGEFQQWHVVGVPGHPFLKAVIENVLRNIECYHPLLHRVGGKAVLRVTGPIAYTLAIVPLLSRYQHRVADRTTEPGFVYSVLSEVGATSHQALFRSHYNHLTEPLIGNARSLVARLTWLRERVSRLLKSLHRRRQ